MISQKAKTQIIVSVSQPLSIQISFSSCRARWEGRNSLAQFLCQQPPTTKVCLSGRWEETGVYSGCSVSLREERRRQQIYRKQTERTLPLERVPDEKYQCFINSSVCQHQRCQWLHYINMYTYNSIYHHNPTAVLGNQLF